MIDEQNGKSRALGFDRRAKPSLTLPAMSDTEEKMLGERERDEAQEMDIEPSNGYAAASAKNTGSAEGDSDDDVGPMPMPAGASENGQTVRRKRKGTFNTINARSVMLFLVLTYTPSS